MAFVDGKSCLMAILSGDSTGALEAIEAGVLHGDPNVVGHLIWSRLHGMVALHLAGMLNLGLDLESLVDAFIAHELDSRLAPGA